MQPTQIRPSDTADICWVSVLGVTHPITITNVYRPPQEIECLALTSALKEWSVPQNCLVAGDFNNMYSAWDSRATKSSKLEKLFERA